jgi:hypothetical protein
MTELLEKAFVEASKLPMQEQDELAQWILDEIYSERRWDEAFASSGDLLTRLGDEALKEHSQGRTQTLDPDKL